MGVQEAAFFDLGSVYSMTRNIVIGDCDYGIQLDHTKLPASHHSDVHQRYFHKAGLSVCLSLMALAQLSAGW